LNEEEHAKRDENDTDNVFHGIRWSTPTTDPRIGLTFRVEGERLPFKK
jgi:hypothetical protein